MRAFLLLAFTAAAALAPVTAKAAAITTETFSAGANGWQGSSSFDGTWAFTGGAARLRFPLSMFATPSSGTLSNLTTATSGSITGNYIAAGINYIGFKLRADTQLPSGITLRIGNQSNTYVKSFQDLELLQTNVWYTFAASLASAEQGGWTSLLGNSFTAALQNVSYIAISVSRSSLSNHIFTIDDIFLGRQPSAASVSSSGGSNTVTWQDLLSNKLYRVECATNLVQPAWSTIDSFTATGTVYQLVYPPTNSTSFYRMVAD